MTDTATPKVETLESNAPPASFDRWLVVSWWVKLKDWYVRDYTVREHAQGAYIRDIHDADYGVVKLLWVSESGRPEPESGVVDDRQEDRP